LTKYPVNLYRDDEMKTLFQAYHHRCLTAAVAGAKTDMPDVSRKGDSVVSFASGDAWKGYTFKAGNTSTLEIGAIAKSEGRSAKPTGAAANRRPTVSGGKSAKKSAKKTAALKAASTIIMKKKTPGKKSTAVPRKGGPGQMATPGPSSSSVQTPKMSKANISAMKKFLQKQKGK